MTIALVVGHKYGSPGACNRQQRLCEYEYNLALVDKIHARLPDFTTRVLRETYIGLPKKLNDLKPSLILSFHCNAYNSKASGTEMLFYYRSKRGFKTAQRIMDFIVPVLGLPDRGVKAKSSEDRGGYLLAYTNAPCIILEPFFIDNNKDLKRAQEVEEELIDAYVDFILGEL